MTNKNSSNHDNKPDKQRALVLQGGGALGAYEVGVIKGLYEKLALQDEENSLKDNRRSLFDIVAGTSIGAMDAAVLVSNVIKKKSWKDEIDELEKFWIQEATGHRPVVVRSWSSSPPPFFWNMIKSLFVSSISH